MAKLHEKDATAEEVTLGPHTLNKINNSDNEQNRAHPELHHLAPTAAPGA